MQMGCPFGDRLSSVRGDQLRPEDQPAVLGYFRFRRGRNDAGVEDDRSGGKEVAEG